MLNRQEPNVLRLEDGNILQDILTNFINEE